MFSHAILVTGMPRSGTSWLGQIFDSHPAVRFKLSPLFSYEFKNQLSESSSSDNWTVLLQSAYRSDSDFMNQAVRRKSGEYPTFAVKQSEPPFLVIKDTRFHNLTRHALNLLPNLTVVAIIRHPCGALHSWLTSRGEFPAGAIPMQEWRSGSCRKNGYGEFWGFEDWKQVTAEHLDLEKSFPGRMRIQRYEDLVDNPAPQVAPLFDFVGLDFDKQTREFLSASHEQHIATEYAVFKNPAVSRRWITELQPAIRDQIQHELLGTKFERFLV